MLDFKDLDPYSLRLKSIRFVPDWSIVVVPIVEGKMLGIDTGNVEWGIKTADNELRAFSGHNWALDNDTLVLVVSDDFDPCFSNYISKYYKDED